MEHLQCQGDGTINWYKPRCICLYSSSDQASSNQSDEKPSEDQSILLEDKKIVKKIIHSYEEGNYHSDMAIGESDSHTCLVHDQIVYFWGGRNDANGKIYRFNLNNYSWLPPLPNGMPNKESRYYHAFIKQGNEPIFWMFGGLDNSETSVFYNDLVCVNVHTQKWKVFECNNESVWPEKRRGHVLVYRESNHSLILFGGCGNDVFSDVWEFDITLQKWKFVNTTNAVVPRGYASGILMKKDNIDTLVIYGGDIGTTNQTLTNELCLLNLNTLTWTIHNNSITPPLFGHACSTCKISNDELYIFGGCNDDYIPYLESYIYNLKNNTWKEIQVDYIIPLNCTSIFVDEKRGLLNFYGGYDHVKRTDTHILIQVNSLYDHAIYTSFKKLLYCARQSFYTDVSFEFH